MTNTPTRSPRPVLAMFVATLALLTAGCAGSAMPGNGMSSTVVTQPILLEPSEFAAAIAEPDRVTINVHTPFEGRIPGTDLDIPFDRIEQQAAMLPPAPDTPLAVYCRTAAMSASAITELLALGYTDIVELDGGMIGWQNTGRTLDG